MNPRISVIIPFYRRFEKLERAVNSVLDQTLPPQEIILIDDGSFPNRFIDLSVYNDDRIQLYRHKQNRGPGAARNTGLRYATGAFISFLDSDDYWAPEFLEACFKAIQKSPDVAFAYSFAWEIKEGVPPRFRKKNHLPFNNILPNILNGGRPWGTCSCLWRKEVIDRVGGWLELRDWEDFNFEIRASTVSNRVICVEQPLCYIEKTKNSEKVPLIPIVQRMVDRSEAFIGIIQTIQSSSLKDNHAIRNQLRFQTLTFLILLLNNQQLEAAESLASAAKEHGVFSPLENSLIQFSMTSFSSKLLVLYRYINMKKIKGIS